MGLAGDDGPPGDDGIPVCCTPSLLHVLMCQRIYCISFDLMHCTLDPIQCRESWDLKGSVDQLDHLEHRYVCLSVGQSVPASVNQLVYESASQSVC